MNCKQVLARVPVLVAGSSGDTRNPGNDNHPGREEQAPPAPRSAHQNN